MRYFCATILLAISGFMAPGLRAQAVVTYRVCLDQGQVVPQSLSSATGDATVVLDTVTRSVTITGSYSGLGANATGAGVHGSAGVGSNAGLILSLSGTGGTMGTFSGSGVLSASQAQNMSNGRTYLQISTAAFPNGEIRGQVVQAINLDCPAAQPTDPSLEDIAGSPDYGPKIGDPLEGFNVALDCSGAGASGIYTIVIRLGKLAAPALSNIGNLWISGPKLLTCGGAHVGNRVQCFGNSVVLPNDVALVGIGYCVQGFCGDPTNRPGRLSNAVYQVVGIGSSLLFQDTFDGTTLDASWSVHNPGLLQFSVSSGELHMQPTASGAGVSWFEDAEGPQIFRNVTGNFVATASLRVEDSLNPGQPPPTSFQLAGLLARDPASSPGNRDSVHVAIGSGTTPGIAEDKTTADSISNFGFHAIPQTAGDVRIARSGSFFSFEYRAPGATDFQVLQVHSRTDLPATLSVGPMVYANDTQARIVVHIDEITIVQ